MMTENGLFIPLNNHANNRGGSPKLLDFSNRNFNTNPVMGKVTMKTSLISNGVDLKVLMLVERRISKSKLLWRKTLLPFDRFFSEKNIIICKEDNYTRDSS
eukprot:TRINITY_DN445_c0_g1_i11.p2 TRINITY_DN445_c0_g1~~TRINITY_DN445_c0_g1_i11.p2  ORF type:complete len:101 (+),score=14.35 TRINITY_DN445_c0_g1_i11:222-524(+)